MASERQRIRWKRFVFPAIGIWLALVAMMLLSIRDHAENGEAMLESVAELTTVEQLGDADLDQLTADLRYASDEFTTAKSKLQSPWLAPIRILPVVGTQLDSAEHLAIGGADVSDATANVLDVVVAGTAPDNDWNRIELLQRIEAELATLVSTVEDVDPGPAEGLVSQLYDGRAKFVERTDELQEKAVTAHDIVFGLERFLADSTYLVLAANNAEMRLGSGMPLSIGVLTTNDGDFLAPIFEPADELFPVPVTPVIDDDIADRWGFLNLTEDFRNLSNSARFAEWSAPQAMAMWRAEKGQEVDGVIQIDPLVLGAMLEVIGPVEVDGLVVSSENVAQYLLIDQYYEFGNGGQESTDERRDLQSKIGAAIVSEVGVRSWDPIDMVLALKPLAEGRHILAYATDGDTQHSWETMGVAGRLSGDEVGVFLLNIGASKLDPFIRLKVDAITTESDAGIAVRLNISVTNTTPSDVNDYAAGPYESIDEVERGDYLARLAIYAPAVAQDLAFVGSPPLEVFGPDGQVWVMATRLTVPQNGTRTRSVTFTLPAGSRPMVVLPSARYPGTEWRVGGESYWDYLPFEIPVAGTGD